MKTKDLLIERKDARGPRGVSLKNDIAYLS
jgi:hypothetical protein